MNDFANRVRRLEHAGLPSALKLKLQIDAATIDLLEDVFAKGLTPEQLAKQWEEEFEQARNLVLSEERHREGEILASGTLEEIRRLARRKGWRVTNRYGVVSVNHTPHPRSLKTAVA